MATIGNLIVKIGADIAGLKKGIGEARSLAGKMVSDLDGLGKKVLSVTANMGKAAAIGLGVLATGAVAVTAGVISAGSDVAEMQSKFNIVFGQEAARARQELDAFAANIGRNKFELQGFAAGLQDTFVPLGFARDKAADMSIQAVKLAEDVASFNNLPTKEVIEDIQAALVGEVDVMRKYGVVINEAAIEQEALNLGLAKGTVDSEKLAKAQRSLENAQLSYNEAVSKHGASSSQATKAQNALENAQARVNEVMEGGTVELDAQTKAMATWSLIQKGTTDAQGDAERTAGGWANQMRRLWSILTQTRDEIGLKLLPVFEPLLRSFVAFAGEVAPQVVAAFDFIVPKIQTFIDIVEEIGSRLITGFQAGGIQQALVNAFGMAADSPIIIFLTSLRDLALTVFGDLSAGAATLPGLFSAAFDFLVNSVLPVLSAGIQFVTANWDTFKVAITGVLAVLGGAGLVSILSTIGGILAALATPIGILIALGATIGAAWVNNWFGIRDAVSAAWAVLQPALMAILQAFREGGLSSAFGELANQVRQAWPAIQATLSQWATNFWNWLVGPGGAIEKAATFLGQLVGSITTWLANNWPTIQTTLTGWSNRFWEWLVGPGGAVEKATGMLNKLADSITKWATSPETQNKIAELGTNLASYLVTSIESFAGSDSNVTPVINALITAIGRVIVALASAIVQIGAQFAASFVAEILGALTGTEIEVWTMRELKEYAGFFLNIDWPGVGRGVISKFKEGAVSAYQSAKDSVRSLANSIMDFFSPTKWLKAGKEIISGIIRGIKDGFGEVGRAISDLAHSIMSTFTDILMIGSPSRVFDDYGGDIDAGLERGVVRSAHKAVNAVGQVAGAATQKAGDTIKSWSLTINSPVPADVRQSYGMLQAMEG